MHEIELKLQVPAACRDAVLSAVLRGRVTRTHLRAFYFDTPDGQLAAAGLAAGRAQVQVGDPHRAHVELGGGALVVVHELGARRHGRPS